MKLSHLMGKKAGLYITIVLLSNPILSSGLWAQEQANKVNKMKVEPGKPRKEQDDIGRKMEVIAVQDTRNDKLILKSLDGKIYHVLNSVDMVESGILRLATDVLYCEVTLVNPNNEGGDVILGPFSNGSPMTKEGEALQIKLWPQIKAAKKKLGHDRWLRFHGDKKAP